MLQSKSQTTYGSQSRITSYNVCYTKLLRDAAAISESPEITTIEYVSPELQNRSQVITGSSNTNTQIIGVTSNYQYVHNVNIASGNFISDSDNDSLNKVAVLGPQVVTDLFGVITSYSIHYTKLYENLLDHWLSFVCGWAETDVLCQSPFTAEDLLSRWDSWHQLLSKLSQDENVHKRRASLVLLTKPLRQSSDPRLSQLAFV